jgi:hypothetical protein
MPQGYLAAILLQGIFGSRSDPAEMLETGLQQSDMRKAAPEVASLDYLVVLFKVSGVELNYRYTDFSSRNRPRPHHRRGQQHLVSAAALAALC